MCEAHIAHSISTFSEIGIAGSAAWLFEVIPLQKKIKSSLLIAFESKRVAREDYCGKAEEFDDVTKWLINLWLFVRYIIPQYLILLLHWVIYSAVPILCLVLGVLALSGIAFYPFSTPFSMPFSEELHSFDRENLDIIYFFMSVISFMGIFIPFASKLTESLINWYALKDVKIE